MADEIKITLHGDQFFIRRIQAMRFRARDMRPILKKIGDEWQNIIEEQFATEGLRGGHKWQKLARDTILRRGSAHPILVETGDMLISMTDPELLHVSTDSITLHLPAHDREKAAAHQYGALNARTNRPNPARPIVVFTEFDKIRWRRQITEYLVHGDGA